MIQAHRGKNIENVKKLKTMPRKMVERAEEKVQIDTMQVLLIWIPSVAHFRLWGEESMVFSVKTASLRSFKGLSDGGLLYKVGLPATWSCRCVLERAWGISQTKYFADASQP